MEEPVAQAAPEEEEEMYKPQAEEPAAVVDQVPVEEKPKEEEATPQVAEPEKPKPTPTPTPKVPEEPAEPTEAENKLKEEAELAKKKLIEEIKQFKTEE